MSRADAVKHESDPMTQDVAAIVLAGGEGCRLAPLTRECCKPALPFAARHRMIDFTLSNCLHSDISRIAVLAQYRADSLVSHVDQMWRRRMQETGIRLETFESDCADGFRGTADAAAQILPRSELFARRRILVLAGDHVYRMDYRAILQEHVAKGADITVACVEVAQSEARRFGVVGVDESGRIITFEEKPSAPAAIPGRPGRSLVSMGIYVFESATLAACLGEGGLDFGHDILPKWLPRARVIAHRFQDALQPQSSYWRDVGTIDAYWQVHMELLSACAPFDMRDPRWMIGGTASGRGVGTVAARAAPAGRAIEEPRLAPSARLRSSVVSPGVDVGEDALLDECIVLPGASIGRGARLRRVIVGSHCRIPEGSSLEEGDAPVGTRSPGGVTVVMAGDLAHGATPQMRRQAQRLDSAAAAPQLLNERAHATAGQCC